MISVSYLSNIAPVFAQPRLFIGPEIPGCLSDRGTVLLPMTLDGRMTDTKGGEGDSTFLTKHRNQFVCRSPRVVVYHDRDAYEAAVHPPWLRRVRDWVDDDWERYASILADHPLQRTVLNRVKEGLQALSPLFSGCLYIGDYEMPRAEHFLYAHDLALYGKKVDVDDESLYPVLRLLETFYYAREQLRAGTHEKIVVMHQDGIRFNVYDVGYLKRMHRPSMEFVQASGEILSLPRDAVRPTVAVDASPSGNIDPVALEGPRVHPCLSALEREIFQRASVFLGFLLVVHYRLDAHLLEALTRKLQRVEKIDPLPSEEHLQFVLEAEMFDLGHNLGRDDYGFEGRCLLRALQALQVIQ